MNSLLPPGQSLEHDVVAQSLVEVSTVDAYCDELGIDRIDLLKTDTQGFDLRVLQGAARMFSEWRIGLVLCEIIFSELYEGGARVDDVMRLLFDHGFELMAVYPTYHERRRAMWTDMLFVLD